MIAYETLLDAARRHFLRVAASPNFTRAARAKARELAGEAQTELDAFNAGNPLRAMLDCQGLFGGAYRGPDPDVIESVVEELEELEEAA